MQHVAAMPTESRTVLLQHDIGRHSQNGRHLTGAAVCTCAMTRFRLGKVLPHCATEILVESLNLSAIPSCILDIVNTQQQQQQQRSIKTRSQVMLVSHYTGVDEIAFEMQRRSTLLTPPPPLYVPTLRIRRRVLSAANRDVCCHTAPRCCWLDGLSIT